MIKHNTNINHNHIEKKVEERYRKREKKKNIRMKVSGADVKKLGKIINKQ